MTAGGISIERRHQNDSPLEPGCYRIQTLPPKLNVLERIPQSTYMNMISMNRTGDVLDGRPEAFRFSDGIKTTLRWAVVTVSRDQKGCQAAWSLRHEFDQPGIHGRYGLSLAGRYRKDLRRVFTLKETFAALLLRQALALPQAPPTCYNLPWIQKPDNSAAKEGKCTSAV